MIRLMRRGTTGTGLRRRLARLREALPHVALRSTVIVGFPGETDADVEELIEFVGAFRFERLGCFTYSREEGTPAAKLSGQIPEAVKRERRARVMEAQREVSAARNRALVGTEVEVLVDDLTGARSAAGRTAADALEIDGVVRLEGDGLTPGTFVHARVTRADAYDLDARVTLADACDADVRVARADARDGDARVTNVAGALAEHLTPRGRTPVTVCGAPSASEDARRAAEEAARPAAGFLV